MGQQHSHDYSENSEHDSEAWNVEAEIQRLRQELQELKQEGESKKRQYREEFKNSKSQFNDSLRRFLACERSANSPLQLWYYNNALRATSRTRERKDQAKNNNKAETRPPPLPATQSPLTTPSSTTPSPSATPVTTTKNITNDTKKPPTVTRESNPADVRAAAMAVLKLADERMKKGGTAAKHPSITTLAIAAPSAISAHFGMNLIIHFFQALLLRKLHIAMMMETQNEKQAKGWSKIVKFYYQRSQDKTGEALKKSIQRVSETIEQIKIRKQEKQDLIGKILCLQQEIMDRLEEVSTKERRSSIENVRRSKREVEMLRYAISPAAQPRQVVDITIEMMPSSPTINMTFVQEEQKEEIIEEDGLQLRMMRRRSSSIENIKVRNRELELKRPKKTLSSADHAGRPNMKKLPVFHAF